MIVLRLQEKGRRRDLRLTMPRIVLGSAPGADVLVEDAGWAPREAVLVHQGTFVELQRGGKGPDLRLRVGDEVRVGHTRLALLGLLPLDAAPAGATSRDATPRETAPSEAGNPYANAAPGTAAGAVVFGDYEDAAGTGRRQPFELADEPTNGRPMAAHETPASPGARPAAPPPPPPLPPRPKPPRSQPASAPPDPRTRPTGKTAPGSQGPSAAASSGTATSKAASQKAAPPEVASSQTASPTRGLPPLPRPPSPAFRQADFGEELVRQMRRAPFFLVSVGVHLLAFFVLAFLHAAPEGGNEKGRDGTIHTTFRETADEELVRQDTGEEPEIPIPTLPEIPTPTLPEEDADPEANRADDGDTLEAPPEDEPAPYTVGMNPSITSVSSGTGRRPDRVTPGELKEEFSKGEAATANERAADYVRGHLGRGTGSPGDLLNDLTRRDILVVDGTFDKIGNVLESLRLPYMMVKPRALTERNAPDLSQHKVIFWNCGESLPPDQLLVATRRIRDFVKKGGYLFTTDWAIGNLVTLSFPGYLSTSGARSPITETVVEIRPAKGNEDHRLLEGVFRRGVAGKWWLEQASFDVSVKKKGVVEVLIESPDLKNLYRRSPVVAATFPYGRGRVLHVMGHYFQEAGNLAGTISAHRLALNFVLMRLGSD